MTEKELFFHSGRFRVYTVPDEKRMSLWVYSPVIEDIYSGVNILDLSFSKWDLLNAVEQDYGMDITLSPYPHAEKRVTVQLMIFDANALIAGRSVRLTELRQVLDSLIFK